MEKNKSRLFGLTVLLAVLVAAMALVAGCGGKSSQQTEAEARTCQANQRLSSVLWPCTRLRMKASRP